MAPRNGLEIFYSFDVEGCMWHVNVAFFHSFNFLLKMKVGINLVYMPTCHLNCNYSLSDTCLCFLWILEEDSPSDSPKYS